VALSIIATWISAAEVCAWSKISCNPKQAHGPIALDIGFMITRKLNGFRTAVEHIESSTELIFSVTKALEIRLYSQKQGRGPNKLDGKQLKISTK